MTYSIMTFKEIFGWLTWSKTMPGKMTHSSLRNDNAECHYAERHSAEWNRIEFNYLLTVLLSVSFNYSAVCHSNDGLYAQCYSTKWHYNKCQYYTIQLNVTLLNAILYSISFLNIILLTIILLYVIMLNIILLNFNHGCHSN